MINDTHKFSVANTLQYTEQVLKCVTTAIALHRYITILIFFLQTGNLENTCTVFVKNLMTIGHTANTSPHYFHSFSHKYLAIVMI